jgi:hypothetical protein
VAPHFTRSCASVRRSSVIKRKWVEGVLGRNGLIYAIPYDADSVLEIDPDNHALSLFGNLGGAPCKWYGGALAPNGKIYAIPYAASVVLEINPDEKTAIPFVSVGDTGWGKWAGGVLAANGKIYGVPALASAVLEVDIEEKQINLYGMLPSSSLLDDKWNGAVMAPNGKMYAIPWRSDKVLEFDPETKAIALVGSVSSTNFTWHGGALTKDGRIVAVPYNSAFVLEIGDSVCLPNAKSHTSEQSSRLGSVASAPSVPREENAGHQVSPSAVPSATSGMVDDSATKIFVLALLGCPESGKTSDDACFHLDHRTWHSAMITIMKPNSMLNDIRDQGGCTAWPAAQASHRLC